MNLDSPIRSVIPSAHGDVLAVLARTNRPLSGRMVAELTDGRVSQRGTSLALRALVEAGVVIVEDQPPAKLYELNRRHLAAESVIALATMRDRLLAAMVERVETWRPPVAGAWLFGSAARGDGTSTSDVDVLVVRPDRVDAGDRRWLEQVERFASDVTSWCGNSCRIVEYSATEFAALFEREDRLAAELREDAVALSKATLPRRSPAAPRR